MQFVATAVAATPPSPPAASVGRLLVGGGAVALEAVPGDIE
jgi:hypothetical protein